MANFLSQTRIGDFIHPKVIASLTPLDNIPTILQVLNNNKILSAPVCDLSTHSMVGVISMADIAIALIPHIGSQQPLDRNSVTNIELNGEFFMQLSAAKILAVSQIFGKYNEINFPIRVSTPLRQVLELFSKGIHRVPVLSDDNMLSNYLTQTEVIQFMAQNLYLLGDTALMSLETIGLCNYGRVVGVNGSETVLDVVKILASHNISAVPVLDDRGTLVANFSLSNLKGLKRENFSELLLPVMDYLDLQRIKEKGGFISIDSYKALHPHTCKPTDTFEATVYKCVATRVHRLWVVDSQNRVVGVVSIGDLFKPFLEEPPAHMPIS